MGIHEGCSRIQRQRQQKASSGVTSMGLHKCWKIIWVIVSFVFFYFVHGSKAYDHESLDAFVRDHANKEIAKPRTGILYNVSLPANFSGMEISVVRVRTASFWSRGVNYSFFNLPPRIITEPNVKRLAIVYENLGNWSSHYYNVPNYSMVAPVLGLMAYNSSEKTLIRSEKMNFTILGDPITVRFPQVGSERKKERPICAKFGADGSVEFTNMTEPYVCVLTQSQGHYTLLVPETKTQNLQRQRYTIWRGLGFGLGLLGLILVALVLMVVVQLVKRRRIRKMEEKSERDVPFDEFWVGESKMPSASMIRTQPVLENTYFPH